MMNYYSAIDRGNETLSADPSMRLGRTCACPSGSAQDWQNRHYDVNLVVADKAWTRPDSCSFQHLQQGRLLGDQVTVNWSWKPYRCAAVSPSLPHP